MKKLLTLPTWIALLTAFVAYRSDDCATPTPPEKDDPTDRTFNATVWKNGKKLYSLSDGIRRANVYILAIR